MMTSLITRPVAPLLLIGLLLAGCPNSTPDPTTAGHSVATPTPMAMPTSPQPSPPQAATLAGQVSLAGSPWANVPLAVFDPVTGQAAGALGEPLQLDGAAPTTDASGHFSFALNGLAPGALVRLVAHSSSGVLTALIGNQGPLLGAYRVRDVVSDQVALDERSTLLDQVASGPLALVVGLGTTPSAPLVGALTQGTASWGPAIAKVFKASPGLASRLAQSVDPQRLTVNDPYAVEDVLTEAGLADQARVLVEQLATQAAEQAHGTPTLQPVTLLGTPWVASVANQSLLLAPPAGPPIAITLPPGGGGPTPTPATAPIAGATATPNAGVTFNPLVGVSFDGGLRLTLSQNAAEDPVTMIWLRIPHGNIGFQFPTDAQHPFASGTITRGTDEQEYAIVQTVKEGNDLRPGAFGGGMLQTPDFDGALMYHAAVVGELKVYHDDTYAYMVVSGAAPSPLNAYQLDAATAPGVVQQFLRTQVDIHLVSVGNRTLDRSLMVSP